MQEREIISDPNFYSLLFSNELYVISDKKGQQYVNHANTENVSEQAVAYKPVSDIFKGNHFPTLLMVSYAGQDQIPETDRQFLGQVLQAVGLGLDKVSVLNVAKISDSINWESIAAQSPSTIVVSFGIDAAYLPSGIGEGQIYNINNKRVLCAASLQELATNVARKKMLWQGLKEIYGI